MFILQQTNIGIFYFVIYHIHLPSYVALAKRQRSDLAVFKSSLVRTSV